MDFVDWLEYTRSSQRDMYGTDVPNMSKGELMEYIRLNVLAATDELHEVLAETGWKPWKKQGFGEIDFDNALSELVDVMHFIGNLFIAIDADGYDLSEAYNDKAAINKQRVSEGY